MSYSLYIEGTAGGRRVREARTPRRGEWLAVDLAGQMWWLPVLEVAHALARGRRVKEPERGCEWVHEGGETIVFGSLGVAVRAEARSAEEGFKLVLPPPRWPFGGQSEGEISRNSQSSCEGPRGNHENET